MTVVVTATSEITFLVPSESALRAVILTRHRGIRRVGHLGVRKTREQPILSDYPFSVFKMSAYLGRDRPRMVLEIIFY